MPRQFVENVIIGISPLVVALLCALLAYGVAFIRKKVAEIDNKIVRESLFGALQEAEIVARDAIKATNQVFVQSLKEKSQDGKLTPEESKQAMLLAKNYFLNHLSENSQKVISAAMGPLSDWLEQFLEARIADNKVTIRKIADPISPEGG